MLFFYLQILLNHGVYCDKTSLLLVTRDRSINLVLQKKDPIWALGKY